MGKIVLEFSGSGIKYFIYEILSGGTYNLKETVNIFKGGKKVANFDNEAYLNSILKPFYDSGELYIFISNGHIEAIKKNTEFSQISRHILEIIKEIDEPQVATKDSITTEGTKAMKYFEDLDIDNLAGKTADYSEISNRHYYGPETEDRLEANAFATLFKEGKIQAVEDYPYCLLFAGSTTIQVMRINKVYNEENLSFEIKYESETRTYEELRDLRDTDDFFKLLKENKNVFFGSNFGWAFLYKEDLSDMTMKKVELLGEGAIQIEGEKDSFQFNADFTSYHTCENDKEKCGSEKDRLNEYKKKPNCCYSTIKDDYWIGFSEFCSKIFYEPKKYFTDTGDEDLPNFYFFRTVKVDGVDGVEVEVEITASRGLIDYSVGKINIPLPIPRTELHLSGTTGAGPPHVEGSMERPIKKKKTKKKGSTKQEKKKGSTKQEKKRGSTKQEKKKGSTKQEKKRGSTKKKNPKKKYKKKKNL